MEQEIDLALVSGEQAKLALPEPGEFTSFYVFSMEHSGNIQFWQLLERLMAAAERPVYAFHENLRRQELNLGKFERSSLQHLFCRNGYGFGIFFDVEAVTKDIDAESHKLLFLRDPRDMLVAMYRSQMRAKATSDPEAGAQTPHGVESAPPSFAEFLQSPIVEHITRRYRRFAEFRYRESNVILLRYEHALMDWHATASEIVAMLKLPIDPLTAASIAAAVPPIGDWLSIEDRPPDRGPTSANGLDWAETTDLEALFVDVLAALGYAPRTTSDHWRSMVSASNGSLGKDRGGETAGDGRGRRIVPRLGQIYEQDPVLHIRLKPKAAAEMLVLGRRVIMDVDETGCRPVIGQPPTGEKTLAVYGCSFTYGIAIAAEETFCSLLQGMFPTWRVENHGVSGFSASRNLIQLERETRWKQSELVTFTWIEHHLGRNVADIAWAQTFSENIPRPPTGRAQEQRTPRAALGPNGALEMRSVRVPRHDLLGIDLSDFIPDRYYLDLVCFRLFARAHEIVTAYGGHFFVTTLQGKLSAVLAGWLADDGIPVVDASLAGNEYLCLPDDPHPNALANRIYAERIRDYLLTHRDSAAPGQGAV